MTIDLDAIRARWAGKFWNYSEHYGARGCNAVLIGSKDTRVGATESTSAQRDLLFTAAFAPDDIRALLTHIAALEADKAALVGALEAAHPSVCSLKCPSVWKTSEGQLHSDTCKDLSALLDRLCS